MARDVLVFARAAGREIRHSFEPVGAQRYRADAWRYAFAAQSQTTDGDGGPDDESAASHWRPM